MLGLRESGWRSVQGETATTSARRPSGGELLAGAGLGAGQERVEHQERPQELAVVARAAPMLLDDGAVARGCHDAGLDEPPGRADRLQPRVEAAPQPAGERDREAALPAGQE